MHPDRQGEGCFDHPEVDVSDSSSVPPVHFRREFQNLPKQNRNKKQKEDEEARESDQDEETPRKGPPPPDGSSTIDLTA